MRECLCREKKKSDETAHYRERKYRQLNKRRKTRFARLDIEMVTTRAGCNFKKISVKLNLFDLSLFCLAYLFISFMLFVRSHFDIEFSSYVLNTSIFCFVGIFFRICMCIRNATLLVYEIANK